MPTIDIGIPEIAYGVIVYAYAIVVSLMALGFAWLSAVKEVQLQRTKQKLQRLTGNTDNDLSVSPQTL